MFNNPYRLDNDFIQQLWERFNNELLSLHTDEASKLAFPLSSLPSPEGLRKILETVFTASLLKEEGKSVQFSLAYLEPVSEDLSKNFIFASQYHLEDTRLVKLAPALAGLDASIGIWPGSDGRLNIWGFSLSSYNALFRIKILAAGHILLSFWASSLLITSAKASFITDKGNLYYQEPLHSRLPQKSKDTLSKNYGVVNKQQTFFALCSIVKFMKAHGNGGALLVVPEGSQAWRDSIKESIPYPSSTPFNIASESLKEQESYYERETKSGLNFFSIMMSDTYKELQRETEKTLNVIGQLTAVDGATVITFNFNILAFGAKIQSNTNPSTVLLSEPFEDNIPVKVPLSELGGTRHQSAAQFVCDQKDSIVFVVSEDGRVTLLIWDDDNNILTAIRNADLTFYG